MKILIACEESQAVCIAFRNLEFEAYSCDIQECSGGHPEWHIKGDALTEAYGGGYEMMIAHPPCTYLSNAGATFFDFDKYGNDALQRWHNRFEGAEFFMKLWLAPIKHICIENPIGFMNHFMPCNQIIHPWYFGDEHKKRTGIWLKNLPKLTYALNDNLFELQTASSEPKPIFIDKSGKARYFTDTIYGFDREKSRKERSKTFQGIANAMAEQWSKLLTKS